MTIRGEAEEAIRESYAAMIEGRLTDDLKPGVRYVWEWLVVDSFEVGGLTEQQSLELARYVGVEFRT
jgi:hypothetical protein